MTICIGMPLDDDSAFILADSCGVIDGSYIVSVYQDKLTRIYAANTVPIVLAVTGANRVSQLIKYHLDVSNITFIPNQPDYNHFAIIHDLVPALHKLFTDNQAIDPGEHKAAGMWDNSILVAIGNTTWEITEAYDVIRQHRGFTVIGAGSYTTSGALRALLSVQQDAPLLTAVAAARIAAEFFVGVQPPYFAYTTRPDDTICHEF